MFVGGLVRRRNRLVLQQVNVYAHTHTPARAGLQYLLVSRLLTTEGVPPLLQVGDDRGAAAAPAASPTNTYSWLMPGNAPRCSYRGTT